MKKIDFTDTRSINTVKTELINEGTAFLFLSLFIRLNENIKQNALKPVHLITIY